MQSNWGPRNKPVQFGDLIYNKVVKDIYWEKNTVCYKIMLTKLYIHPHKDEIRFLSFTLQKDQTVSKTLI